MDRREFLGAAAGLALTPNLLTMEEKKKEPVFYKEAELLFVDSDIVFPRRMSTSIFCDLTLQKNDCKHLTNSLPAEGSTRYLVTFNNAVLVERKKKERSNHWMTKKRPIMVFEDVALSVTESIIIIHPELIIPISKIIWVVGYPYQTPEVDFSFYGTAWA